ncbi:unnamed protein product [Strongylus vulgaris]|uniref:OCIA domain-containing protein n=1 Tax=Strongylus vulgaris TaxID=40348 RepID=A0A3P7LGR1_STRVU|nr:unnamed protein product [Strongylus vulgaris]
MSFGNEPGSLQLSNEELQKMLLKMSSDDRDELTGKLRQCTQEMTMTRGIPITAAVLGSLYYARTRLPPQYHFGPKGWPFYAFVGVATLTTVNVFSMGTCRDRVQPLVEKFYKKYNIGQSTNSYDAIRQRHREEYGYPAPDNTGHAQAQQSKRYGDMQAPRRYGDMQAPTGYGDMQAPTGYGDMQAPTGYGDMQAQADRAYVS